MTPGNSRHYSRRKNDRRVKERRGVDYPFGSPEWIARVQRENVLWPKRDRRSHDRRVQDRRKSSAQFHNGNHPHFENHSLLTEEEKRMLAELMRSNHPD